MSRKIVNDLVGKRFGSRIVLGTILVNGRTRWRVLCDCGTESIAQRHNVIKAKGCKKCAHVQTHCIRGHELTEDNLYFSGDNRTCKTCVLGRSASRYNNLDEAGRRQWMLNSIVSNNGRNRADYEQKKHLGSCAICGKSEEKRGLCSDHDHSCCSGSKSCGKCLRDFLCQKCNQGIGFLLDSPELMRAAAVYIEVWRKRHESN